MEFTPSGKVYIEQGRQEGNEAKNPTKQDQNDRKTTPLHAPSLMGLATVSKAN